MYIHLHICVYPHNTMRLYTTACVLILLCVSFYCNTCPHTTICVLILLYVSSYYYICVRIRRCKCPHTTMPCICVPILPVLFPHICGRIPSTHLTVRWAICVCLKKKIQKDSKKKEDGTSGSAWARLSILLYVSSFHFIHVLIVLYVSEAPTT